MHTYNILNKCFVKKIQIFIKVKQAMDSIHVGHQISICLPVTDCVMENWLNGFLFQSEGSSEDSLTNTGYTADKKLTLGCHGWAVASQRECSLE